VEGKKGFSLHLQSYDDKPSGNSDGSSCSNERTPIRNETKRPNREFNEAVPRKITKQTTIESAFQIHKDRRVDPLDAARGRVHLYSPRDIERASEGRKEYYTFWNTKAQELCSNQNFKTYTKQKLHGVIDTAWQMRSCDTLTTKVEAELQDVSRSHTKTVNKNLKRVQEAKHMANELNLQICKLKQQTKEKGGLNVKVDISKREDNLSDAISEVKLILDALRVSRTLKKVRHNLPNQSIQSKRNLRLKMKVYKETQMTNKKSGSTARKWMSLLRWPKKPTIGTKFHFVNFLNWFF